MEKAKLYLSFLLSLIPAFFLGKMGHALSSQIFVKLIFALMSMLCALGLYMMLCTHLLHPQAGMDEILTIYEEDDSIKAGSLLVLVAAALIFLFSFQ